MSYDSEQGLYGITSSNRPYDRLWGKNAFNSNFPIALSCYMRDYDIPPVYVSVSDELSIDTDDNKIYMKDVFGNSPSDNIHFEFESVFSPFEEYIHDNKVTPIDVVTMTMEKNPLRPIEVKLTVIPDSSTISLPEDEWSSEIVIRPVSSSYALMSIWNTLKEQNLANVCSGIKDALEEVGLGVEDWNHKRGMINWKPAIMEAMERCIKYLIPYQRPFVLQPIWKTKRDDPILAERCFDIFVWSDLAVVTLPFLETPSRVDKVSRTYREIARHAQCLFSLSTVGKFNYESIYQGMPLGMQTDKSFAISGKSTRKYLNHNRLRRPHFSADILPKIILGGGEKNLKPERRLDATIYFTSQKFFS